MWCDVKCGVMCMWNFQTWCDVKCIMCDVEYGLWCLVMWNVT